MERAKQFSQLLHKYMEHPKCSYWSLVKFLLLVIVCFILSFSSLIGCHIVTTTSSGDCPVIG